MKQFLPLLIACAVIGLFTLVFVAAYIALKRHVKHPENERHMTDSYQIKRLLQYARPYTKQFVLVFFIMLVSIAYEINRLVGRYDNWLTKILTAPGLWLQRITTNEPDDEMMEVGIAAVQAVLPSQEGADRW